MIYSPIVVFAFNRLDSLKKCIDSLLTNKESKSSDLYIFVDGAREHKFGEYDQVKCVQEYVQKITGFKSLTYKFSETNKGLANSIISGVSEVINEYGSAIVLEDDLIVSMSFLQFMNDGLQRYKDVKSVYSVCGYSNKMKAPSSYIPNTYFCTRSSSWGWATWKDRWVTVDWKLYNWTDVERDCCLFNKWGGSDLYKMLNGWHTGKNNSWAIRFVYSQFKNDGLSIFPTRSLVDNNGFDGTGTNCKTYSRFKCDYDCRDNIVFTYPENIELNTKLYGKQMRYNSIPLRIWSKIMYLLYDMK